MKPIVAGLTIVLVGLAAAPFAAQQPQPTSNTPAHKVYVLSGCLNSTPGATDAFKLTGAVPVGPVPPEHPAATPEEKGVYVLLATSSLTEQGIARPELQGHVGKKVEVTVRPVEVAPGPSSTSASATPPEKLEQAAPPPRYTVTKIRALAGSCT